MKECENIKISEYGQIHHCTGHKKKQFRGSDNQPMVVMINMMIIEIVTPIL